MFIRNFLPRLVWKPKEQTATKTQIPPNPPVLQKKTSEKENSNGSQGKTPERVNPSTPQRKAKKRKIVPAPIKRSQRERRAPKRFQAGDGKVPAKKAKVNFVKEEFSQKMTG